MEPQLFLSCVVVIILLLCCSFLVTPTHRRNVPEDPAAYACRLLVPGSDSAVVPPNRARPALYWGRRAGPDASPMHDFVRVHSPPLAVVGRCAPFEAVARGQRRVRGAVAVCLFLFLYFISLFVVHVFLFGVQEQKTRKNKGGRQRVPNHREEAVGGQSSHRGALK